MSTLPIHTPLAVRQAIGDGEISGAKALLDGRYTIEGDADLLQTMREIFAG